MGEVIYDKGNQTDPGKMTLNSAIEQAMAAREVVSELVSQREGRLRAVGVEGWMRELTEEAIGALQEVGVSESVAREDLAMDLAEEKDPRTFLETLVAETRTVRRLGKMGEVAEQMKRDERPDEESQDD